MSWCGGRQCIERGKSAKLACKRDRVQALCTEACLAALRRSYPQIYDSDVKLLVDPTSVEVMPTDFSTALAALTPASHRSAAAHARHVLG